MTPDQWERAKELFDAALELAPGERNGFLDQHCQDDPDVRAVVDGLLESADQPAKFLETPIQGAVTDVLSEFDRRHNRGSRRRDTRE